MARATGGGSGGPGRVGCMDQAQVVRLNLIYLRDLANNPIPSHSRPGGDEASNGN